MATNPLIDQGTLNRLRGSITIPNLPALNITAAFLGKAGINLALQGSATTFLPTMTGAVTSLEPYQAVILTAALLKTQALSGQWKAQQENSSILGPITVKTDSSVFPDYNLFNCAIESVRDMSFAGDDPQFMITIGGYYPVNAAMWNQT